MNRRPRPSSEPVLVAGDSRGRWTVAPSRPRRVERSPWSSAVLLGVLGLLLAVGLGKFATDALSASAQDGAVAGVALDDPCVASGLIPVGDTGLCTHGPDQAPPGADEPSVSGAGIAPPIACEGNGTSGTRVQVLYGRSSSGPRLATKLDQIRGVAANANQIYREGARQTGGSRSIRFVHTDTPTSCQIDVREVILSSAGLSGTFSATVSELKSAGYSSAERKYMIFVDASAMCGIGTTFPDDRRDATNRNNNEVGYSRVDLRCWLPDVVAHELMHNMGAVQDTAPNTTFVGHCTDEWDVMCYEDSPTSPPMRIVCPNADDNLQLDCNHDDYFHTNPLAGSYLETRWNSANNRALIGAVDQAPLGAPANDNIENAVSASTRPYRDVRRVVGTATSPRTDPNPSCTDYLMTQSVWYKTTPSSAGTITVDTAGTRFKAVLSVWAGAPGSLAEVACNVDLSDTGRSKVQFAARANTTYYVMVASYFSNSGNEVTLTIDGVGEGPPPGVLTLDKEKSKYNGPVTATVSGLAPNSAATLYWPRQYEVTTGPNDGSFTAVLSRASTDANGRATFSFRTPLEPTGDYVLTASDASGGRATDTLRVIPRILLNVDEGPTTTRWRVYFYGFGPNERIEVRWHADSTIDSSYQVLQTLTVASNGRASAIVAIPSKAPLGPHMVVGKVIGVGRSASTPFVVTAGGASIDDGTATPTATATPETSPTAQPEETTPEPTATPEPSQTPEPTATAEPLPTETSTPVPNASPVAAAGDDQTVVDADGGGDELVTLDGSASADPEGGPLAYSWTVDGAEVATGSVPTLALPVGATTVVLTVTDGDGATAADEVLVTVEAAEAVE